MYLYCHVYVFLQLCMFCSVHSVSTVPSGTLQLPWLRFPRALSSAVRQMPGHNWQRLGTARTVPNLICVLFVCKRVLYCIALPSGVNPTAVNKYIYLYVPFTEVKNKWSCISTVPTLHGLGQGPPYRLPLCYCPEGISRSQDFTKYPGRGLRPPFFWDVTGPHWVTGAQNFATHQWS